VRVACYEHGNDLNVTLHVEYAERGHEYGILCIFNLFCECIHFEYVRIHVIYGSNLAEYVIHILVVARQEYVKQSTGHTHTGHTDRENTPDTGRNT